MLNNCEDCKAPFPTEGYFSRIVCFDEKRKEEYAFCSKCWADFSSGQRQKHAPLSEANVNSSPKRNASQKNKATSH